MQALEKGGLTLAEATSLYEQGMGLVKTCSERLDTAELRIKELQTAFVTRTESGRSARMVWMSETGNAERRAETAVRGRA